MILADLVAQLEAAKFLRLFRHLVDEPVNASGHDELKLPAVPVPVDGAEVLAKTLGHVGSISSRVMTWLFQIVHVPAGLWASGEVDRLVESHLSTAFSGLAKLKNPAAIFASGRSNHRTPEWNGFDQWGDPGQTDYYVFTNVLLETAQPALKRLTEIAGDAFALALPEIRQPRFGLATPASLEFTSEHSVRRFVAGLLREPSGIQVIAREGRLSVAEFTEHGEYVAGVPAKARLATAVRSLKREHSRRASLVAEFEDLINHRTTREADLQHFFATNPAMLLGASGGRCEVRSHLCLTDPSGNRLVPDFMARIEDEGAWTAIELKLPRHPVLVDGPAGPRPSAMAARAVAQLIGYRDHFASPANRRIVLDTYGMSPFEPALAVVIGRDAQAKRMVWRGSSPGLPEVDVITYDHLLGRAREWVGQLERPADATRPAGQADGR